MISNRSVATIDRPEFIDIQPYNPLISQCTIKVLYLGKNRNGSFIDKNTAIALKQIAERRYYQLCNKLYKDIFLVGINYNSDAKKCECKITKYSTLMSEKN